MDIVSLNELKERIKQSNPIEEVISEKLPLNAHFKAICPFHKEETPSFSVNVKEQYFHCFGCGKGGDVIEYIMLEQNIDFWSALKLLAVRKGIEVQSEAKDGEQESARRGIEDVLSEAAIRYNAGLPQTVRQYLNERGITDETISKFKIGFCNGDEQLSTGREALIKAGVLYDNGNPYFKGFITFPHIHYGRISYISGRGYPEKKHKKLEKEKVALAYLYNEQAVKQKDVIIAEGESDTLTLLQNSFNACGVLGAGSFNEGWIEKFSKSERVFISFDGDKAGETGNLRIAELLGGKARIVRMPTGKDVNDFFKDNKKEDYQKLLDAALSVIEYRIKSIPKDSPKTRLPELLKPVMPELAKLSITEGDAVLNYCIKEHFGLSDADIRGYRKELKGYRHEPEDKQESRTKAEIMSILKTENEKYQIHPAQDFANGNMFFAVKIDGNMYVVSSNGELTGFDDENCGIELKHKAVDLARFSYEGILSFLEKGKTVNFFELYNAIHEYISKFIKFPEPAYLNFIVLWVIGTYCYRIFRYYPYVWLNAEKGSGKSLLMAVLKPIAFNAELITNPTEAVIFRDVSNNGITMFVDEVEQLRKQNKDVFSSLISLLNVGFEKSGSVKRIEGNGKGGFESKAYNAYSPKMFAGINDIDDVLQDRTIRIPLLRKKDSEPVQRYKETPEVIALQKAIRDDLYIFALRNARDMADCYHQEQIKGVGHLGNRELDIWEPVFLLANMVDIASDNKAGLTAIMDALSKKCSLEKQSESVAQNDTYKLLNVMKPMLEDMKPQSEENGVCVYKAEDVLAYFKQSEEFGWMDKTHALTRLFKKIGLRSEQKRIDGEKQRAYVINRKNMDDLCERFKIVTPEERPY